MSTLAEVLAGADMEGFEAFCDAVYNAIKNNFRGATLPTDIQPGMLFSRNTDNRLSHNTGPGTDWLIFQGDPVCAANAVVCAGNEVVVVLPV